jgi:2-alkyl-3-oxoalkanoate reductase
VRTFAVVGAGGFIGYRLAEYLLLNDLAIPRPIIRSRRSMARLSKFDLDIRVADATNQEALTAAMAGCEAAFHCVVGNRQTILNSIDATYAACREAGVKRLVYLSSAVVHGYSPDRDTDEESPLLEGQPFDYNASKVLAEQKLRSLMSDGAVECVILRPSIVYGPRSTYWSAQLASDILAGKAFLVDGGQGICNTIFIDNLVEVMSLCATHPAAAGQTFLVRDAECVTWGQLYAATADAIGVDPASIRSISSATAARPDASPASTNLRSLVRAIWRNRFVRAAKELIRSRATVSLAIKLRARFQFLQTGADPGKSRPDEIAVDPEMLALQMCQHELPARKLGETLNYKPSITFYEGTHRTAQWLRFAFGNRD